MNKININGTEFDIAGRDITINGSKVTVDGTVVKDGLSGIVEIKFEGDLASLDCGCTATITGDVKGDVDAGNSVHCGNVGGDIDAGNSVHCGDVSGEIDAGNSVHRS